MKYLRMIVPHEAIAPASATADGRVLNVQLLPDGTLLELALVRVDPDELFEEGPTEATAEPFRREVVETGDGRWYVYQHCRPTDRARELLEILNDHRMMIVFPITFEEDAGVTVEVIGSESDVQDGFDALPPDVRRRTSIERVGDYSPGRTGVGSALTERQREVLDAATAVGYYDVPRRGTADDVAEAVGCAPSTASEHLRKIEARILPAVAGS